MFPVPRFGKNTSTPALNQFISHDITNLIISIVNYNYKIKRKRHKRLDDLSLINIKS